jgi:acyl-CoA thioesterase
VNPPPDLSESLRVQLVRRGVYRARISADWNAPVYPSGGVTTAVALRAMEAELDQPHQRLRSFSTTFVSTVASGAVDVHVERLRIGKRMSQLRADVRSAGGEEPGHVVTAAYGEARPGFDVEYLRAPDVGSPAEYPPPAEPPPGAPVFRAPFFENIETRRIRLFHSFETGWDGGRAESVRWVRYRSAPRLGDGRIDPLSLVGLADTMPSSVAQYLGPGYPFFHAPSVDLSMRMFADTEEEWILLRCVCHWAGDGYASAEAALWDARRKPVAHATQMMLIRLVDPEDLAIPPADGS